MSFRYAPAEQIAEIQNALGELAALAAEVEHAERQILGCAEARLADVDALLRDATGKNADSLHTERTQLLDVIAKARQELLGSEGE